uniref:Uncharacterized protein n=1 Tax=Arundo donax TaxID=35708 RepID=A0A0A9B5R9_ARUDO
MAAAALPCRSRPSCAAQPCAPQLQRRCQCWSPHRRRPLLELAPPRPLSEPVPRAPFARCGTVGRRRPAHLRGRGGMRPATSRSPPPRAP